MKPTCVLAAILITATASFGQGIFSPFYFRAGAVGGASFSRAEGARGFTGVRTEYGFSPKWAAVGDFRTGGQGSLAARYFPFQTKTIQPYLSVGFGAGTAQQGAQQGTTGYCHRAPMPPAPTSAPDDGAMEPMDRKLRGLMLINAGANFRLSNHLVGHVEAYAQRYMQRHGLVSAGFQAGIAYQFGKGL